MAYSNYIIPGLAAVAGGFDGRGQSALTSSSGTTRGINRALPIYDPASQNFKQVLMSKYLENLNTAPNLAGYTAGGIQDINTNSDLQRQSLEGILAARGISGNASASPIANLESQRFGAINKFEQGIPLLERQMKDDALAKASSFFNTLPVGQESFTDSTESQNQNQQTGGNKLGGAIGAGAETLAYLLGTGAVGGGLLGGGTGAIGTLNPATGALVTKAGIAGGIKGLGTTLATLASNPITWGIAAGVGAVIAYKKIGQGRKKADEFIKDVHNKFFSPDQQSGAINQIVNSFNKAASTGQLDYKSAKLARIGLEEAIKQYKSEAEQFKSQGENERKVIDQNYATLRSIYGSEDLRNVLAQMDAVIGRLA